MDGARLALVALGLGFAALIGVGYVDTPRDDMDLLDSLYFSVETLATIGYGDFALDGQPAYMRVATIIVMILTTILLAILYALVTDYLVSRRIAATSSSRSSPTSATMSPGPTW